MKNILILTGSPRKGGNSDLMADAFTEGAIEAGHIVTRYETAIKNIQGCRACDTCFSSSGVACTFHDDFNELAPLLEKADLIVFATPLYWFSFSSQIKAAIDKLYAFIIREKPWHIKECVLLVCGESNDGDAFNGIIKSYELIADYNNWVDAGRIIVPGVSEKGAILNTNALQETYKLACNI
jgi:multimeric flavodoxin WrbA